MTAHLRPWLTGLAVLVALALVVLLVLAFIGMGHDMNHLDHVAGKAWKGDP